MKRFFTQLQDHRPQVPPDLMAHPVPMGPTGNTLRRAPRPDSTLRHREATQAIQIKDITILRTANNSSSRRQVDTRPRVTVPRRQAILVTSTALLPPGEAIRTKGILRNKAGCPQVPRRRPKGTGNTGKTTSPDKIALPRWSFEFEHSHNRIIPAFSLHTYVINNVVIVIMYSSQQASTAGSRPDGAAASWIRLRSVEVPAPRGSWRLSGRPSASFRGAAAGGTPGGTSSGFGVRRTTAAAVAKATQI